MSDPTTTARPSMAPVLLVAVAQGLLLQSMAASAADGGWITQHAALRAALTCLAVFIPPLLYSLQPWAGARGTWAWCALLAALVLAGGALDGLPAPGTLEWREPLPFGVLLVQGLALFHAVPFLQARLETGRWAPKYVLLFRHAWLNALQLALAALFTGIVWVLLVLWGQLFAMIGLPFAHRLLHEVAGFAWLPTALAFGIGFHLAGSAARLLAALRQQVLALLKWLAPMAAAILVAFAVAMLVRTPALLAERQHAIKAVWLLWLVIVTVYLYNAAFEDGTGESPYPPQLGRALRWATPLLVLLAALAAWDVWVRIDAYGITVQRYWAAVVALVSLVYALGYARAGLRAGPWMAAMSRANEVIAIGIVALLVLAQLPALSPLRLAAQSQARELAHSAGRAGPESFIALRFDLGAEGYRALQGLAASATADVAIRAGAREALALDTWAQRSDFHYTTVARQVVQFAAFPAGAVVEPELRGQIEAELGEQRPPSRPWVDPPDLANGRALPALSPATPAWPVLFIDLDGDHQPEAIAFLPQGALVFARSAHDWHKAARLDGRTSDSAATPARRRELLSELQAGQYAVLPPRWGSLRVGGEQHAVYGLPGKRAAR